MSAEGETGVLGCTDGADPPWLARPALLVNVVVLGAPIWSLKHPGPGGGHPQTPSSEPRDPALRPHRSFISKSSPGVSPGASWWRVLPGAQLVQKWGRAVDLAVCPGDVVGVRPAGSWREADAPSNGVVSGEFKKRIS